MPTFIFRFTVLFAVVYLDNILIVMIVHMNLCIDVFEVKSSVNFLKEMIFIFCFLYKPVPYYFYNQFF
jgi:hypothetical protein